MKGSRLELKGEKTTNGRIAPRVEQWVEIPCVLVRFQLLPQLHCVSLLKVTWHIFSNDGDVKGVAVSFVL